MEETPALLRRLVIVFAVALELAWAQSGWAAIPGANGLSPIQPVGGAKSAASPIASFAASATVVQLPSISSLSPASAVAGGAALTLTIHGARFTSSSQVRWGASVLKTAFVSSVELTAAVPASLIATPGTATLAVFTAAGASAAAAFTVTSPPPAITSLSPVSTIAGRAFAMTVSGRNFVPSAAVKLGSATLETTYISATQLTAAVPANLVSTGIRALVTVTTAAGTSPSIALAVTQPAPVIASLSPASAVAAGPAFTLAVNGSNFVAGAEATVVRWNNTTLTTTYVSSTRVTAAVPASLIGNPGTPTIAVVTAGGTSSGISFAIEPAPPVITGIAPSEIPAGYGSFQLTLYGSNFTSAATVNWGATQLPAVPLGGSALTTTVPASLVATAGTTSVTVTTAGGTSTALTFKVYQPLPVITSLSPNSIPAGSGKFTLTINGANFASTSQSRLGTTWLVTTYVSSTELTAVVQPSAIASAASTGITIYISGLGWSPSAAFTVLPAPPAITSLAPASLPAGSAGFMLTIKGTAFTPASTAAWGATSLGTVYVSPTQLIASVPASLVVNSGTANVTVTTAAGTSTAATFTVNPSAPAISSLSPGLASAGGAAFTLAIGGEYFTPASVAKWGSTTLATTYMSETQLTAAVPAKLIASAGTASITVTTSAGTSGPAAFTVGAAPIIVTTALPTATAGMAYSGPITVTGGVPGYAWTLSGLPDGMSSSNTSGSTLTIAGTPATSGTFSFQVSVEDAAGSTAAPVALTLNVAAGPDGAYNGSLNGRYTCLLQGFFDADGSRWASVASLQADGNGSFTTGVFDTNGRDIGSASGMISGSYNTGSDFNGVASLHTILTNGAAGIQTTQWALALDGNSQPAQRFRMVEADDLGESPSGQHGTADCQLANSNAFTAGAITGSSFAFGIEGEDDSGNLKAAAGFFSVAAGNISNGGIDLAQNGSSTVQTTPFTGSVTAPDLTTGRFELSLDAGSNPSGFTVYIIDSTRMFVLDNTSNNGEQAGEMRVQQPVLNSAAEISGPFVLYLRGAEMNASNGNPAGGYAEVLQGSGDGRGDIIINQSYKNQSGVYSAGSSNAGPIALAFDSAHLGRATFPSASGSIFLYFFNNNSAFELSTGENGSVATGWLEPQIPSTAQLDSAGPPLSGNALVGELPLLNEESNGSVGEMDFNTNNTILGAVSTAGEENLSWDRPTSATVAWDAATAATGTFLIAYSAQAGESCAVINSSKAVCIPQTDPSPSVQVIQQ